MSEYQCYDVLAVDRPLNDRQQAEVRALSTRARIFRGQPEPGDGAPEVGAAPRNKVRSEYHELRSYGGGHPSAVSSMRSFCTR